MPLFINTYLEILMSYAVTEFIHKGIYCFVIEGHIAIDTVLNWHKYLWSNTYFLYQISKTSRKYFAPICFLCTLKWQHH